MKFFGTEGRCDARLVPSRFKVTVHVGTDQNIETEIFAEYKYTLNELLGTKIVFQYV